LREPAKHFTNYIPFLNHDIQFDLINIAFQPTLLIGITLQCSKRLFALYEVEIIQSNVRSSNFGFPVEGNSYGVAKFDFGPLWIENEPMKLDKFRSKLMCNSNWEFFSLHNFGGHQYSWNWSDPASGSTQKPSNSPIRVGLASQALGDRWIVCHYRFWFHLMGFGHLTVGLISWPVSFQFCHF
jgi:hypothetical protein